MNYTEKGSKLYLFSIVLVAVIGGLLFGYDTAVISGAEKGLQAFFMGADFEYTDAIHGITSSSALIGCIIGSAVSGFFASGLGRKTLSFWQVSCSSCRRWVPIIPNSCSLNMAFLPILFWWLSISTVSWAV